jgi:hypothetical protein
MIICDIKLMILGSWSTSTHIRLHLSPSIKDERKNDEDESEKQCC